MNRIKQLFKKTLLFSCLGLGSLWVFSSCEDFLDKSPLDAIGSDTELNATDAIALINSAYQPLQWPKLYNMRMWTTDVIASNSELGGEMTATDGKETKDLASFIATSDNSGSLDLWRGPNPGILRCNIVLNRLPAMENIDPAIKDRVMGEAHFLRAHYYFILVRIFGDVPLRTEPVEPGDGLNIGRTPQEQVYGQIIADCEQAIALLPPKSAYSSTDMGRACKDAAIAMLAKIYLTLGSYSGAVSDYSKVVSLCEEIEGIGYDLSTMNYYDNFDPLIKNNAESLFEIQYTVATGY
ncbi:RagB/SusD family nutrient uptake outer membrane protein, partial [termite gut metagenome]